MLIFMGKLQQEKQDKALMQEQMQQEIDELKQGLETKNKEITELTLQLRHGSLHQSRLGGQSNRMSIVSTSYIQPQMMQVNDFNVSYAESNGDGNNDGPNMSFVQSQYSANVNDQL